MLGGSWQAVLVQHELGGGKTTSKEPWHALALSPFFRVLFRAGLVGSFLSRMCSLRFQCFSKGRFVRPFYLLIFDLVSFMSRPHVASQADSETAATSALNFQGIDVSEEGG